MSKSFLAKSYVSYSFSHLDCEYRNIILTSPRSRSLTYNSQSQPTKDHMMDPDKLYLLRVSCAYDSWSTSGLKNLKKLPQRQLTKKSVNFCRGEKNGIFPAISVNKGCHSHWQLQPPGWLTVEPWGNSGKKRIPAIQQPWDYRHSLWWTLKKLRMWKYMILAPDSWGTYQRQDFREPRLLHLPIHRKVLNSLTWDIWFYIIYYIYIYIYIYIFFFFFLMFRLPTLCCKNHYIS